MNNSDEFIQKQIEDGITLSGADAEAYKMVFSSLRKEPNFKLPADFANKVSMLVSPEKSIRIEKYLLIGGGFGFLLALIYTLIAVEPNFSFGAFTFLSSYKGLLFFGLAVIAVLNWLDKKLIHSKTEHTPSGI